MGYLITCQPTIYINTNVNITNITVSSCCRLYKGSFKRWYCWSI